MQFVDMTNDIAFRKIFGNENKKIILISFLNAVLKLEGNSHIVEVEILNPYQLSIVKNLKASIIDVRARDKQGNTYIVEMQVSEPDGLDKRLLYYVSKDYSQQIESGQQYPRLRPVIFIGIFDFLFTKGTKYLSHHAVCDVEDGERVIKDMDFYFIELPKFNKSISELETITDKWIHFIKEAENLDAIPENLDDNGLKAAYNEANRHSWTKEDLDAYDYSEMRVQDERGKIELAEKKGEEKSKIELIIEMGKQRFTIEQIASVTKKSEEEARQIIENHKNK